MHRPDRLNAMSIELVSELHDALDTLADENDTWVVVLTGSGRGVLLGARPEGPRRGPEHRRPLGGAHRPASDAALLPAGAAAPADAPAGDRRGERPGLRRRHVPRARRRPALRRPSRPCSTAPASSTASPRTELGASWLLPRLIGVARSNDLLLTGRVVDAAEALRDRAGVPGGPRRRAARRVPRRRRVDDPVQPLRPGHDQGRPLGQPRGRAASRRPSSSRIATS